jgi:hypothetical protein
MKKILIIFFIFSITIGNCYGQYRSKEIKTIDILCHKLETKKWIKIRKFDLIEGDSETKIFYSKNGLQKILHTNFAESSKTIIIYFMVNKQIVKVSETEYNYHGNYANTKLNQKATTIETLNSYFQNDKMFHQIGEDCGAAFSKEFLESETLRLYNRFKEILDLTKKQ